MPGGQPWPQLTIVTPSYNQGRYLEETIRSVLLQGYPRLEYLVLDGGSSDKSLEIIRKYAPWLSFWESGPDRGQSHAINKGLAAAGGDIIGWLNSDDIYSPDCMASAAVRLDTRRAQLLVGGAGFIDATSLRLAGTKQRARVSLCNLIYDWWALPQPACLWTRPAQLRVGLLDESLHYAMDRELFLRMYRRGVERVFLPQQILAFERKHEDQKTQVPERVYHEYAAVLKDHFRSVWDRGLFRAGLASYPRWQGLKSLYLTKAVLGLCPAQRYVRFR